MNELDDTPIYYAVVVDLGWSPHLMGAAEQDKILLLRPTQR